MDNYDVSSRFEALINALNISYLALSKKANMSKPDTLYHLKAGKTKPSFETLRSIVKAFPQTNVYFLLGLEENPIRETSNATELKKITETVIDKNKLKNLHKISYSKKP